MFRLVGALPGARRRARDRDPRRLSRAPAASPAASKRRWPARRCPPSRATTTCWPRTTSTTASGCGSSTTSTAATTTRPSSSATRPRSCGFDAARQAGALRRVLRRASTPALLARMRLQMIMSDVGWTLWAAIQAASPRSTTTSGAGPRSAGGARRRRSTGPTSRRGCATCERSRPHARPRVESLPARCDPQHGSSQAEPSGNRTHCDARRTAPERAICTHDSGAGCHFDARSDVGGTRCSPHRCAACGARSQSAADRSRRKHRESQGWTQRMFSTSR